jgi:hypothetical protein
MAEAPTAVELGPLLGESAPLDEPMPDPYEDENSEFMSAARAAVGGDEKATALKDAITACLREHGLLKAPEAEEDETQSDDVGIGFEDF